MIEDLLELKEAQFEEEMFVESLSKLNRGHSSRSSMNETPIRSGHSSIKKLEREDSNSMPQTKLTYDFSPFGSNLFTFSNEIKKSEGEGKEISNFIIDQEPSSPEFGGNTSNFF